MAAKGLRMSVRNEVVTALSSFYVQHNIHVGNFACEHRSICENFARPRALMIGMEAHVGSRYGERLRTAIVSLDAGNCSEDLETRTRSINDITPQTAGNPHMCGTAKLVQVLLGGKSVAEFPMNYVAMLNSAKCAGNNQRMDTVPFPVHKRCSDYLFEEIRILKPDIIWLQGRIVSDVVSDRVSSLVNVSEIFSHENSWNSRQLRLLEPIALEYVRLFSDGRRQIVTIKSPHPSDRYGRWGLFERSVMPLVADIAVSMVQASKGANPYDDRQH